MVSIFLAAACSDDTGNTPDASLDSGAQADQTKPPHDGIKPDTLSKPDQSTKPLTWKVVQGGGLRVYDHTATRLKDGRVLIAGGMTAAKTGAFSQSAYLYNPKAVPKVHPFLDAGQLKTPRVNHTATLLDDGRVLIAGGQETIYKTFSSVEIFDPAKPAASAWSTATSMGGPRSQHRALKFAGGSVMVVGGIGNKAWEPLQTIEIYNPKNKLWVTLSLKMKHGRQGPSASTLKTGEVLIAGGYDGKQYLSSIELYDPKKGTLTELSAKLSEARMSHTATVLADGRVLIVGGHCGTSGTIKGDEIYDPVTNKVTAISHSGSPPSGHTATFFPDGNVMIAGGTAPVDRKKTAIFTPSLGGMWVTGPAMNQGRSEHTATLLLNGEVLVVGGFVALSKDALGVAELLGP